MNVKCILANQQIWQIALILVPIIISALLVYFFGLRAYKKQKNYEEVRNYYLRNGLEYLHEEISLYFAAFQYNYEVLQAHLKNVRDYLPGAPVTFKDIKKDLVDYFPRGFAFRAIQRVEALIEDDAITKLTLNLFSYLSSARIAYDEIYLTIGKIIDHPQLFYKNKSEQQEHYDELNKTIEKKREQIYEKLDLINILDMLINRINEKSFFYTDLILLRAKLRKDEEVKKIVGMAIWHPVMKEMLRGGIPITAFLGSFMTGLEYRKKRILRWQSFMKLIDDKIVLPCTYEEATSPPEIQVEAEKWKVFLKEKYNREFSGAYKLNVSQRENIDRIGEKLVINYLNNLRK